MTVSVEETRNSKVETGSDFVVQSQASIDNRQSSTTLPLLLEVGCEEIPARFLRDAEKGLGERVGAALETARLFPNVDVGEVRKPVLRTFSTPRRLVVHVPALLVHQPDKVDEILGPPVKVAVDAEGKYTRAAESFAQKNSARPEDLARATTPKGDYVLLRKTTQGRPASKLLAEILPGAILELGFPKSMYWRAKSDPRFVRPIRWVLALLGEGKRAETIPFEILGVKSGNYTFGHRTKSVQPLPVSSIKSYINKLSQHLVKIDHKNRLELIQEQSEQVASAVGGKLVHDDWLADWIANSTEWPLSMPGSFDERFLHLPREILITVMRDHQRYFAVEDEVGNLRPNFVAVLNMDSDEKGLIRQGHQRVLTARFRDAEFFWSADQKTPLRDRVPRLDRVTYQVELGSYGEKIRRVSKIADKICAKLEAANLVTGEQRLQVARAVELCKCDLTTQMVQEFTELQGVVGGLYAKAQGEPEEIAIAIYDHYLPLGAEGASPRTQVGALVSLADKVDSVVAGFAVGYEPTGSSDPFALRRQANGIIKVILENNITISLKQIVANAIESLADQGADIPHRSPTDVGSEPRAAIPIFRWRKYPEEVQARVLGFFAERLRYYFESVRGFRYDTVRAVLAAGADEPADAQARAEAIEALRGSDDFEALCAGAKRIRNILSKSATATDWQAGEVATELLTEPQELELSSAYRKVGEEVEQRRARRDYRPALEAISTLRPAVDRFFDKVLVMAEDGKVRRNRLRLLKKLDEIFSGIAIFAEIAERHS